MKLADPTKLLRWLAEDRAMVEFKSLKEINDNAAALQAVVRQWIKHVWRGPLNADARGHFALVPQGMVHMTDARSKTLKRPNRRSVRWSSFVAGPRRGRVARSLEEEGHPSHRVRVEYNSDTLLVHVSGELDQGWTTLAIDRATREWSISQRPKQLDAAKAAYAKLYR